MQIWDLGAKEPSGLRALGHAPPPPTGTPTLGCLESSWAGGAGRAQRGQQTIQNEMRRRLALPQKGHT